MLREFNFNFRLQAPESDIPPPDDPATTHIPGATR